MKPSSAEALRVPPASLTGRAHADQLAMDFKTAGLIFLITLVLFIAMAENVFTGGWLAAQDRLMWTLINDVRTSTITPFMRLITDLHSTVGVLVLCALLSAHLWYVGETGWIKKLWAVVPSGMLVNVALKNILHRPRPSLDGLSSATFCFPSGHTAGATLFYLMLSMYLMRSMFGSKSPSILAPMCAGVIALVAFSRVYLGEHYLSDVLAAAVVSSSWIALCMALSLGWQLMRTKGPIRGSKGDTEVVGLTA